VHLKNFFNAEVQCEFMLRKYHIGMSNRQSFPECVEQIDEISINKNNNRSIKDFFLNLYVTRAMSLFAEA